MWWWSLSSDHRADVLLGGHHVLVTGAGGAIGRAVAAACVTAGASASGIDLLAGPGGMCADVTDEAAPAGAFGAAARREGGGSDVVRAAGALATGRAARVDRARLRPG